MNQLRAERELASDEYHKRSSENIEKQKKINEREKIESEIKWLKSQNRKTRYSGAIKAGKSIKKFANSKGIDTVVNTSKSGGKWLFNTLADAGERSNRKPKSKSRKKSTKSKNDYNDIFGGF